MKRWINRGVLRERQITREAHAVGRSTTPYLPPTRVDQHLAIGIATERSGTTRPKGRTSSGAPARSPRTAGPPRLAAVGETAILLHPSLPLVGASIRMERERQQNDRTLAKGDTQDIDAAASSNMYVI